MATNPMRTALAECLPSAVEASSFDAGVWFEFDHDGSEYLLFDEWNYGNEVSEHSDTRYWLCRYTPDRATAGSRIGADDWVVLGRFGTPTAAFNSLK